MTAIKHRKMQKQSPDHRQLSPVELNKAWETGDYEAILRSQIRQVRWLYKNSNKTTLVYAEEVVRRMYFEMHEIITQLSADNEKIMAKHYKEMLKDHGFKDLHDLMRQLSEAKSQQIKVENDNWKLSEDLRITKDLCVQYKERHQALEDAISEGQVDAAEYSASLNWFQRLPLSTRHLFCMVAGIIIGYVLFLLT